MVETNVLDTLAAILLSISSPIDPPNTNVTKLDCGMRKLAFDYASKISVHSEELTHVFEALRLSDLCGTRFEIPSQASIQHDRHLIADEEFDFLYCSSACVFVSVPTDETAFEDGSMEHPWTSIHDALSYTRTLDDVSPTIVLREGVHSLGFKPIELGEKDSGMRIIGFPGESVWISGGVGIYDTFEELPNNIFVANVSTALGPFDKIPSIVSLFTTNGRYTRARYPNSDPEVDQWGYASQDRLKYSISAEHVLEWHRPEPTTPPNVTLVDLSVTPPPGVPVKNNSAQEGYNWFTSGRGGSCADVWGPDADSYWCSSACQGGWAEVDAECAKSGSPQIPIGMTYNTSSVLRRFQNVSLTGGIIHAWHSQSWAMHMFRVSDHSNTGEVTFEKGGGRQGGRNWCRYVLR